MAQIFENSTAVLDFLEADEPECYVFRGQTRSYGGPLLPSGSRDRFTPFEQSSEPSQWSGITNSISVIKDEARKRRQALGTDISVTEDVDDGKTIWDLQESAYQMCFRVFYNQPNHPRMRGLSRSLSETNYLAMATLLGGTLANLLCQQYGFISDALDASTDPSVAMFFATHEAPFYNLVTDSSQLGVIYRWPRERATIAQDVLLPLEGSDFESVIISFRNLLKNSTNLKIVKDVPLLPIPDVSEFRNRQRLLMVTANEEHPSSVPRFPIGAFEQSRMGRQQAALLWPKTQVVKALIPRYEGDYARLVGDVLTTHQGEVFYFRHTGTSLPERLNKFTLWPSIRPSVENRASNFSLEIQQDHIEFEDPYLEMFLRFFSTCSPCDILMMELIETEKRVLREIVHADSVMDLGGNRRVLVVGSINGVVDLGYLLHPSDVDLIAKNLRTPETYMPIPAIRYIPTEHLQSFQTAFADAMST